MSDIVRWLHTVFDDKRITGAPAAPAAAKSRGRPEVANVEDVAIRIVFRRAQGDVLSGRPKVSVTSRSSGASRREISIGAMAGDLRRFRKGERPLSALALGKGC
ncbi:MAG: hypothetical protein ACHQK9_21425 [Reyranellales bacterium]